MDLLYPENIKKMRLEMQTNKKLLINPELLTAIQKYKESLKLSKKNPE